MYRIVNCTRIKPRSRPPQKKIPIFYAPRFFSSQNRKKKSAQITRANTVMCYGVVKHTAHNVGWRKWNSNLTVMLWLLLNSLIVVE
jgi:hypothetical protein